MNRTVGSRVSCALLMGLSYALLALTGCATRYEINGRCLDQNGQPYAGFEITPVRLVPTLIGKPELRRLDTVTSGHAGEFALRFSTSNRWMLSMRDGSGRTKVSQSWIFPPEGLR